MTKIITVTAHSALDLVIEVEGLSRQDNLIATASYEFASGKGVNVAKAITTLGHPVICLGFVGRQSLPVFKALASELLTIDFIAVDGKNRTNVTVCDRQGPRDIHVRTAGYRVTEQDCQNLFDRLAATIEPGDLVILSGSLPPGAPEDTYRALIELGHRHQAICILDASGPSLKAGIQARPWLVKPNRQELEELVGKPLTNTKNIVEAARRLVDLGIEWIHVSLGLEGVISVSPAVAVMAKLQKPWHPNVSSVGCGDAMVAGLAVARLGRLDHKDAIKLGIACASANLSSPEPGRFDPQRLAEAMNGIELQEL